VKTTSLKLAGTCQTCLHGSETSPVSKENEVALQRAEMIIIIIIIIRFVKRQNVKRLPWRFSEWSDGCVMLR